MLLYSSNEPLRNWTLAIALLYSDHSPIEIRLGVRPPPLAVQQQIHRRPALVRLSLAAFDDRHAAIRLPAPWPPTD